jgi:hypothetical protein
MFIYLFLIESYQVHTNNCQIYNNILKCVVHNNTANIIWWNHYKKCFFIGKLDIFPLMYAIDKIWITELTLIHKNIRSVLNSSAQVYWSIWCKTHYDITDKNNNVSSEGLDRHHHIYPSSYYRTRWDICDKVCLDFQNNRYSIYAVTIQTIINKYKTCLTITRHKRSIFIGQ